jgi:hypothetical protein
MVRLTVAATRRLAGDKTDEPLQGTRHPSLVLHHRLVELDEGSGDGRTPHHGQDAVRTVAEGLVKKLGESGDFFVTIDAQGGDKRHSRGLLIW